MSDKPAPPTEKDLEPSSPARAIPLVLRDLDVLQQNLRTHLETHDALMEETRATIQEGWCLLRELRDRLPN